MNPKSTFQNNEYKDLIGLSTLILFSKELFPKNTDIEPFIKEVFNLSFKGYLYKSRTLLVARVNKYIYINLTEKEVKEKIDQINYMLNRNDNSMENVERKKNIKPRKRSKAEENLSKWLDNI